MTEALHSAKCDVAGDALRSAGVLHLRVQGTSMLPTLWPGDLLRIHRIPEGKIEIGDVVLFRQEDRFFVHRVQRCADSSVLTRGDSRDLPDPELPQQRLLGRVESVARGGAWLPVPRLTRARRLAARLLRRRPLRDLACAWARYSRQRSGETA